MSCTDKIVTVNVCSENYTTLGIIRTDTVGYYFAVQLHLLQIFLNSKNLKHYLMISCNNTLVAGTSKFVGNLGL